MKPMRLMLQDGAPSKNWACGVCRHVRHDRRDAEECCRPYRCKTCGVETKPYSTSCLDCTVKRQAEKERVQWERAEPVEAAPMWYVYNGTWEADDRQVVEDAVALGEPIPYVYAAYPKTERIDAADIIESLLEDIEPDAHPMTGELEASLQALLDAWVEEHKADLTFYWPDHSKKSAYADQMIRTREEDDA